MRGAGCRGIINVTVTRDDNERPRVHRKVPAMSWFISIIARRRTRHWALAGILVAGVGVSSVMAITSVAAPRRNRPVARTPRDLQRIKRNFAAFRDPLRHAHTSAASSPVLPENAIVAAVVGGRELTLFVGAPQQPQGVSLQPRQAASEELCISDRQSSGGGGGIACSYVTTIEREGMVLETAGLRSSSIAVLVPNGVSSATVIDSDGLSHELRVSNNVAEIEDASASSVSYTMPNGSLHQQPISGPGSSPERG